MEVIIVDPIYKVITGDENNASDMGAFCGQFDYIAEQTGCSMIYCHHHSKGAQGSKRAMDRASGSGVFARDPDAQLDIIELSTEKVDLLKKPSSKATAWRMESSLREFANIEPFNFWFEYPLHSADTLNALSMAPTEGSAQANLDKSSNRQKSKTDEQITAAFDELTEEMQIKRIKLKIFATYLGYDNEQSLRNRLGKHEELKIEGGRVVRVTKGDFPIS